MNEIFTPCRAAYDLTGLQPRGDFVVIGPRGSDIPLRDDLESTRRALLIRSLMTANWLRPKPGSFLFAIVTYSESVPLFQEKFWTMFATSRNIYFENELKQYVVNIMNYID